MNPAVIFIYFSVAALIAIVPLSASWKGLLTKDEESTTWLDLLKVTIYIMVAIFAVIGLIIGFYYLATILMLPKVYGW